MKSKNPLIEEVIEHHSYKDFKSKNFNLIRLSSWSSKHLAFCSCQIHHMRHNGTTGQTPLLPLLPHYPDKLNKSLFILYWIRHQPRNTEQKKYNEPQIPSHWTMLEWIIHILPLRLHMKHHSKMIITLFLNWLAVKILLRITHQTNKATLDGVRVCHMLFHGNCGSLPCKTL